MTERISIGPAFAERFRLGGPAKRVSLGIGGLILAGLLLYYPVGMALHHRIDDNRSFQTDTPAGGSDAVAMAAALIEREVNENGWVANDPWFLPASALDNMPNYQQGLVHAMSLFAIEMTDQMGRIRGSSAADTDLEKAAGLLRYPGNRWHFDLSTSWAPTATSESQYRDAAKRLMAYNQRLAEGSATFDRRADNLLATLERFNADIGSESAILDRAISDLGTWSMTTDDKFYRTKGKLYGYLMILTALGTDFDGILTEKEIGPLWAEMLASLGAAVKMDPLLILNASPDSLILPSHLATQGFYLLRARTRLKEIVNVLLK